MNKNTTKRSLLASVMALALCVIMLVGTTFAWFTDTASTSVNKIESGKLKVDLEMQNSDGSWVSAEGETLQFKKAAGHENEAVLWEPGCTYELPALRVVNKGNLALKYKIEITGIKGDAKLNEVIDWTINGSDINLTEGHLAALQEGTAFTIKGQMQTTAGNEYQGLTIDGIGITVYATQDTVESDSFTHEYDKDAEYPAMVSELKAKYGVDGIFMPTGVEIEAQGEGKFTITLKDEEAFVYFTQVFDRVAACAAREEALDNRTLTRLEGESVHSCYNIWYYFDITVKLDCDVDLAGAYVKQFSANGQDYDFDGQGHTIKNAKLAGASGFFANATAVSNVTLDNIHVTGIGLEKVGVVEGFDAGKGITNVTVKNSSVIGGKYTGAIVGDCYGNVTNCTVENTKVTGQYKVGGIAGYVCKEHPGADQYITGNTLKNITINTANLWAGKETEGFIIGKVVGHWNHLNGGNASCKDNTISRVTGADNNIGKASTTVDQG